MSDCKVEKFTLKELSDALTEGYYGKKKIVVPMFQRGKRWSSDSDKEEKFIDSLKRNFPVGTLLFYKTIKAEGNEIYTLIDGLQRSVTIRKYLNRPTKFFKISQINANVISDLYKTLKFKDNEIIKSNDCIEQYIKSLDSFDKFDMFELVDTLQKNFPDRDIDGPLVNTKLKAEIKKIVDEYLKLCKIEIPALIYTGPEETLAEIFDRVNSQGVPLTDYEIFVASWPKDKFTVFNNEIINENIAKYDYLNSGEYELQGYNSLKFRNERLLNSFEYVFGFSNYICKKYDSLKFNMNLKPDIANPVGFELINACFYTSHKSLKDVYKIILNYKDNISLFEECIETSIKFVEQCISPITKFKSNTHGEKGKLFHSQLQILSMISSTFRMRYNIDDLTEKTDWPNNKKILERNFIQYYVLDIITKYWHEGGGKIYTANSENRYLNNLNAKVFSNALDTYSDNVMLRREVTQIRSVSEQDYVILNTIYMNTFTAKDQLSIEKFDVEHIATKDQMKKLIKKTNSDGLPISHIANLCYLPEAANRSKKENNFYQDTAYLEKANIKLKDIEQKYSFTEQKDLEWMNSIFGIDNADLLRKFYISFLSRRYELMKSKFLGSLGFDSQIMKERKDNKRYLNGYSENDFITKKIGEIVQNSLTTLIQYNKLTEEDIEKLLNRQYSKEVLGCNYPVFVDSINKVLDENGNKRYYVKPYLIRGKNYYLSNDWYDESRELIIPWLKNKMEMEDNKEADYFQFL